MTENKALLSNFKEKDGPTIVFRDNYSGKIRGYDIIGNCAVSFSKVGFVESLKHNLLSINQLYNKRQ